MLEPLQAKQRALADAVVAAGIAVFLPEDSASRRNSFASKYKFVAIALEGGRILPVRRYFRSDWRGRSLPIAYVSTANSRSSSAIRCVIAAVSG